MKYRLMHECQCWPLWYEAGENIHPSDLPISASLSEGIVRWSDIIDEILPLVENPSADYESEGQKLAVMENGKLLAIELQKELGPSDEVEFRFYSGGGVHSWKPNSVTQTSTEGHAMNGSQTAGPS
jgi:hypothetical protein